MNTVAIIQARMGSGRLPGKVLSHILDRPMLGWVVERTKLSNVTEVVVATTKKKEDDTIEKWCKDGGYKIFRGSENDVLERFYKCAENYQADAIVRITADDPLKDPIVINQALEIFSREGVDYCSNTINPSYPEGLDIEVFSYDALEKAFKGATLNSDREHVTPYIWNLRERFSIAEFAHGEDLSQWRWTVDKPDDLDFIRDLLVASGAKIDVSYVDLIRVIKKSKALLLRCTGRTIRNEGYLQSLNKER